MPEMTASVTFGASSFETRLLVFFDGAKYVMFSIVFCSLSPAAQEIYGLAHTRCGTGLRHADPLAALDAADPPSRGHGRSGPRLLKK